MIGLTQPPPWYLYACYEDGEDLNDQTNEDEWDVDIIKKDFDGFDEIV